MNCQHTVTFFAPSTQYNRSLKEVRKYHFTGDSAADGTPAGDKSTKHNCHLWLLLPHWLKESQFLGKKSKLRIVLLL